MNLPNSYFSIQGPRALMERFANPYRHRREVAFRGGKLTVRWTSRAERVLHKRGGLLPVEMQLYFACVVKKRIRFPDKAAPDSVAVENRFLVRLTTVESERCDPVTFAAQYPARRELVSAGANRMRVRELLLDYRRGRWQGEFFV